MGIASVLAVILVVLKATGFTALAWGWCLAGFGFDILLATAIVIAGYCCAKKATTQVKSACDAAFMRNELDKAKDKLG
jgi:hypothetical protein